MFSRCVLIAFLYFIGPDVHTRAIWKFHVLTFLLRVGTLWRCGDGLFFEVPPLTSDALLTTLHPLLENMLKTVCRKLQEDSGTGGFDLGAPISWLEKPRNRMGRDLDRMTDVVMGFHRSRWAHPLPLLNRATLTLRLVRHPNKGSFKTAVTPFSRSGWSVVRSASLDKGGTSKKRPSPHLQEVPTRQTVLVYCRLRINAQWLVSCLFVSQICTVS
jgi:hypothetical protein